MHVTSEPPGAEIFVDGEPAGVTPTTVSVPLRETPIHVRVEGYAGAGEVTIERKDVPGAIGASAALGVTGAALSIVAVFAWVRWTTTEPVNEGGAVLFAGTGYLVPVLCGATALARMGAARDGQPRNARTRVVRAPMNQLN